MSTSIELLGTSWQAVRAAAGNWHLPGLSVVWIKHTSNPLSDEKLKACEADVLRAAEADRGWMRFQSAAFEGSYDKDGQVWSGDPGKPGKLLWAEWVDEKPRIGNAQVSYRITPDPEKNGSARQYTYRESSAPAEDFLQVLAQDAILQGHHAGRALCYRVYWGAPDSDPSAIRRLFARFVGFAEVRS